MTVAPTATTADPVATAEQHLTRVQAESAALDAAKQRANAALEAIARDLPIAQSAADVALAQGDGDPGPTDRVRKLELERNNAESVLRGVEVRRPLVAQALNAAHARVGRARALAALPPAEIAESAQEILEDGFGFLAELIANGARLALGALPQSDLTGAVQAYDEMALARWIIVKCNQAGLDLRKAQHIQSGGGTGPVDTLANLRALLEGLL